MPTPTNPMDLLDSLQAVRKFRRSPITTNIRKELEALEKRISNIEKFLKNVPQEEEPKAPEGFMPIQYYFHLKPEVSETQIRKWLDDAVLAGTVEVGRWRYEKSKKMCKWYRAKAGTDVLS